MIVAAARNPGDKVTAINLMAAKMAECRCRRYNWDLILMLCNLPGCEEGAGLCAMFITIGSLILILVSLPLSLFFVVKVVQVLCRFTYLSISANLFVFLVQL